jgi:hypothetical protein
LNKLGWKAKAIFHPIIFGAAWLANCAPYPIEKIFVEGLPLSIRTSFAKNKNE